MFGKQKAVGSCGKVRELYLETRWGLRGVGTPGELVSTAGSVLWGRCVAGSPGLVRPVLLGAFWKVPSRDVW